MKTFKELEEQLLSFNEESWDGACLMNNCNDVFDIELKGKPYKNELSFALSLYVEILVNKLSGKLSLDKSSTTLILNRMQGQTIEKARQEITIVDGCNIKTEVCPVPLNHELIEAFRILRLVTHHSDHYIATLCSMAADCLRKTEEEGRPELYLDMITVLKNVFNTCRLNISYTEETIVIAYKPDVE